jgi:hypothetical protein
MPSYGVYSDARVAEVNVDKITHNSGGTLGFFGVTPSAQTGAITSVSTSAALSICGSFGFTSTQANGLITAVNAILAALNARGLMA